MKYRILDTLHPAIDGRGRGTHPVLAEFIDVCHRHPTQWVEFPLSRRWPGVEIANNHRRSVATSLRHAGLIVRQRNHKVYARVVAADQ